MFGRIYLNGYVPICRSRHVVQFLALRGFPIPSPVVVGRTATGSAGGAFFADANSYRWSGSPRATARSRRCSRTWPAGEVGRFRVAAIGWGRSSSGLRLHHDRGPQRGAPHLRLERADRRVTCYYFYLGRGFRAGVCQDRQLLPIGEGVAERPRVGQTAGHDRKDRLDALANGFATCEDPEALQQICDRLGPAAIHAFFDRWLARLPLPLTEADRANGYWWELSMRQIEVSKTMVFDSPRNGRAFFEALVADNLDLGRPEQLELIFGRRILPSTSGVFATRVCHPRR